MEEKIVGNKKEGSSFSRSLSLSCIYLISHLSIYLLSLPTIYHPTLVHRQHGIPCSLWTSNTRLASPIPTEDTSGMVRSETDSDKGTAPPKPIRRLWTMGTVPATDKGFIDWVAPQPKEVSKHGTAYCMNLYVQNLNFEERILYDRQLKEYTTNFYQWKGQNLLRRLNLSKWSQLKAMMSITWTFPPPWTFPLPTPRTYQNPNPKNSRPPPC